MADSHWRGKEGIEKKCVWFRDDSWFFQRSKDGFAALMNCVFVGYKTHWFLLLWLIVCWEAGKYMDHFVIFYVFMNLFCMALNIRDDFSNLSTHLMADSHWRGKEWIEKKCVRFRDDSSFFQRSFINDRQQVDFTFRVAVHHRCACHGFIVSVPVAVSPASVKQSLLNGALS